MKTRYIIGSIIIVVFFIWGANAFLKTTIRYVSIDEARRSQKTVQVMGKIDPENINYNTGNSQLEFTIYDPEAPDKEHAKRMKVVYNGVIPANFDQATSVVLKGKSEGDTFVAEQMLVKCPSKYQGEGKAGYQDVRKHNKGVHKPGV